jgi:hypothetical protein
MDAPKRSLSRLLLISSLVVAPAAIAVPVQAAAPNANGAAHAAVALPTPPVDLDHNTGPSAGGGVGHRVH